MMNPLTIEEAFKVYSKDIARNAPDWVIKIDLHLLHQEGILQADELSATSFDVDSGVEEKIAEKFHVIESPEKVTLFNDQFTVWIVPRVHNGRPETYTMVASNREARPHLELVFETSGVFNTPSYILQILEHYLDEIVENNETVRRMQQAG